MSFTLVADAGWIEVAGAPGLRKYLRLDSAERRGDVVRVTELIDFTAEQRFSGEPVLSIRWINDYHCERKQTRVVSYEGFAEPMGQGVAKVSGAEDVAWENVPDGSLASKVWAVLCDASWDSPDTAEAAYRAN